MRFKPETSWWDPTRPPLKWQREALIAIVAALSGDLPESSLVQAVMGAGKSFLIAGLCAAAELGPDDAIVVTTSSRKLVKQLGQTLGERLGVGAVGRFYSDAKEAHRRVIVCCVDSTGTLANRLAADGRVVRLWIADEAHQTRTPTFEAAFERLSPHASLGLSATPYRSKKSEELSLFKKLVYRYSPVDALLDGVILPWRVVPWSGEDIPLDAACAAMIRQDPGPCVVNANSIKDADDYAAYLTGIGIRALAVHSKLPDGQLEHRLELLRTGLLDCIVHVSTLQEGVDLPWLGRLCLRRLTRSRVRFAQEVGRVLRVDRANPLKVEGIIYDPNDLFGSLSLTYSAVLFGQAEAEGAARECSIMKLGDGWWSTSIDPLEAGFARGRVVRIHTIRRPTPYVDVTVLQVREGEVRFAEDVDLVPIELVARLAPMLVEDPLVGAAKQASLPASEETMAVSLEELAKYLRVLTCELEQTGRFERRVASRSWRDGLPYRQQWVDFKRVLSESGPNGRRIPEPHRSALRNAAMAAHRFNRGQLADLTSVLRLVVRDGWPLKAADEGAA